MLGSLEDTDEPIDSDSIRSDVELEQDNVHHALELLELNKDLPTKFYGPILVRALEFYNKVTEEEMEVVRGNAPSNFHFVTTESDLESVRRIKDEIARAIETAKDNAYDPSKEGKTYADGLPQDIK
ncbi:MAG TPA: hypothetical protein VHK86_06395 [Nitrososphaera sp.]|nr:hypothetical protein [Nitrososphaera sp.]